MSDTSVSPPEYWGYLIRPDNSPSPVFEQLLLGIANYINRHIAPWNTTCLTPTKLAAFYRLVGGDFDPLFLETPQASLSFIYQKLGCYHTLQPEKDPYTAPSTPALTPLGFVRWQTVQLLLEPDEHAPILQEAVKRFDITNPVDGIGFPSLLPREALPFAPDLKMVTWHEGIARKLQLESDVSQARAINAANSTEINDGTLTESSITSSVEERSLIDAVGHFSDPRSRQSFRPPPSINIPQSIPAQPYRTREQPPWSSERRRSSLPDLQSPTSTSWHRDNATPKAYYNHNSSHRPRPRSPSTISTSSTSSSSSSSLTVSSASQSPIIHYQHHRPPPVRRHSSYAPSSPNKNSNDRIHATTHPEMDYFPPQQPSYAPTNPLRGNARGLNVHWRDMDGTTDHQREGSDSREGQSASYAEASRGTGDVHRARRKRSGSGESRRVGDPLKGVGGRQYPPGGINWG
ncbi:MAG: hypothetical protein Q9190_001304 [Brigantiaea leucoxantha]